MNGTFLSFDANPLQTSQIFTEQILHEDSPTKSMGSFPVAHANYSVMPYVGWTGKTIILVGTLRPTSGTIADMDILADTFKGYFNRKDAFLDINYANSVRRYVATGTPHITRTNGLAYATFTVELFCTQPFGRDITPTTLLNATGRTLAAYTDTVTFIGSAAYQLPILTVTYTALTGGTAKTVNFGNNSNGQQISLTRNWVPGDVFAVDVPNKLVLVNGASVDFVGAFPEFPPGVQSLAYSDSFTTRTMNENLIQYPLWS